MWCLFLAGVGASFMQKIFLLNVVLSLRYGGGLFAFHNLINGITMRFSTEFELQEVCNPHSHKHTEPHIGLSWGQKSNITYAEVIFSFFPQLKTFKEEHHHAGFGSATLAMEQAIEKTTANIKWVMENKAEVLKWLTDESTWEPRNLGCFAFERLGIGNELY